MKRRNVVALVLVAAAVVLAGVAVADYLRITGADEQVVGGATTGDGLPSGHAPPDGAEPADADGRATVTIYDENGTRLGLVSAYVSDTPAERYAGLSPFAALGNGSGMLFVYDDEGERTYVMRKMDFPLDMVFVGSDGHVTTIHEAPLPPEDADDLKGYSGRAQWVLEVPRGWTDAHGVSAGDRIEVSYPENASLTPTPAG